MTSTATAWATPASTVSTPPSFCFVSLFKHLFSFCKILTYHVGAGLTVDTNTKMTVVAMVDRKRWVCRSFLPPSHPLATSSHLSQSLPPSLSFFCWLLITYPPWITGDGLGRGVVLVMSIWVDYAVNLRWLDSSYPTTDTSKPGVARYLLLH